MDKFARVITWHKAPEGTIERQFFEYHYLCSRFVVIYKEGNYISYFGEFGKNYVWEASKLMNE